MREFYEKWIAAVEEKNSVLCAGLDPAPANMGRGEKGLGVSVNKLEWSLDYIEAVAPFCAALKPNVQYWKNPDGMKQLSEIVQKARKLGLVVIDDSKLADIGSTNEAGVYHSSQKWFDAVTVAPYAGNMQEVAKQAEKWEVGTITMCLMSNLQYQGEKNMFALIPQDEEASYQKEDLAHLTGINVFGEDGPVEYGSAVRRFVKLAHDAQKYGIDGVVIGAPSEKNHITREEIQKVRSYLGDDKLALVPGVGAQGGETDAIWDFFGPDHAIVNVGRALMLPNGSFSTPEDQAHTAKFYRDMLNDKRHGFNYS